jgi:5-methylcytosine-specific restriction endonuclease McrA
MVWRTVDHYRKGFKMVEEHHETGCPTCGKDNPGKNRVYCSPKCRIDWYNNHSPKEARQAKFRIVDVPVCNICGRTRTKTRNLVIQHLETLSGFNPLYMTCLNHQDNLQILCAPCHKSMIKEKEKEKEQNYQLLN